MFDDEIIINVFGRILSTYFCDNSAHLFLLAPPKQGIRQLRRGGPVESYASLPTYLAFIQFNDSNWSHLNCFWLDVYVIYFFFLNTKFGNWQLKWKSPWNMLVEIPDIKLPFRFQIFRILTKILFKFWILRSLQTSEKNVRKYISTKRFWRQTMWTSVEESHRHDILGY